MASRQFLLRLGRLPHTCVRFNTLSTRPMSRLVLKPLSTFCYSARPMMVCRHLSTGAAPKFECINIQDEEDFKKRVVESSQPVVVDFHATWCGPCKLLGPRLESIIASKEGKVILAKVDIDENTELAMRFGVKSVPTVIGVKKGKVLDGFVGLQEDDLIKSFVEKLL